MKSGRIASIVFAAIVSTIMLGCADSETEQVLARADSLMDVCSDSIYQLLDSVCRHNADAPKSIRMRAELLRAKAQNKSNRLFRSDSIMKEVVNYYDIAGSDNERMDAHYILGCVYRDMGEAPIALDCYYDAVSFADTTDNDCDYSTLFRIYGQMALIYSEQRIPEEEISALEKTCHYANKAGDMFSYVKGLELMVSPYYELADTSKVLEITDKCHELYLSQMMPEAAAAVYPEAIYVHVQNKKYSIADSLMRIFENESGLFNEVGDIVEGREDYYYIKGLYLLGVNRLNNAEVFFRKLLDTNRNLYAYDGLLQVYRTKEDIDSVMKFSELLVKSADNALQEEQAQAIIQAKALYDFSRLEKAAEEEAEAARQAHRAIIGIIITVAAIIVVTVILFRRNSKRKRIKILRLQNDYSNAILNMKKTRAELSTIESVNDNRLNELMQEKKSEIAALVERVNEYESKFAKLQAKELDVALQQSDIAKLFKHKTIPMPHSSYNMPNVTENDWERLLEQVKLCLPSFYTYIKSNHTLTPQELKVCVLTRLNFSNKEIATILGTGTQNIPNAKKRANYKLFGEDTALSLHLNLLNKISSTNIP